MDAGPPECGDVERGQRPGQRGSDPNQEYRAMGGGSTSPRSRWTIVSSAVQSGHVCSQPSKPLVRSQGGPWGGLPFSCFPTSAATGFDSQLFRVLLRHLWRPLPQSSLSCQCGRQLVLGHHQSACAQAGSSGFLWCVRVCREAGARVSMNVRDLDLPPQPRPGERRLMVGLVHGA